jgi:putative oxidoreductase
MIDLVLESYRNKRLPTDLLRMYFGIALFLKGIYFITNIKEIFSMLSYQFPYVDFIFAHYVVLAHIGGGVCILLGFFTRYAALANIPVLVSAIFFVQAKNGVFNTGTELELVVLVLVLLLYFVSEGSGILSADTYVHRAHEKSENEEKLQRESNRN